MAEGLLVDLNDYNTGQEQFNIGSSASVPCLKNQDNVHNRLNRLVDKENENIVCHSNNYEVKAEIETSKGCSTAVKRWSPVSTRPDLNTFKTNSDKKGLWNSFDPLYNTNPVENELQNEEETEKLLEATDNDNKVDVCVKKRDSRTSRQSRSSAGASGGVFGEDYGANIEELKEEVVTELEFENKNEEESLDLPEEIKIEEDFSDIDCHNIVSTGGDDRNGRRVIVFSACQLPDKSEIDHQKLFRYMKYTLDQYVENDYSVVYFHHGLNSRNKPSLSWVVQVYHELDRKYKKNLKALFLVHPTSFIKVLWNVLKPFISAKFGQKVMYVKRLSDLQEHLHIPQLDIPHSVKTYDDELTARDKPKYPPAVFHTPLAMPFPKTQQFGVCLDTIKEHSGEDIPSVVRMCIEFLQNSALCVEGIFRRSANASVVKSYEQRFNKGEEVKFRPEEDSHVAAVLLKKFLRELPEPLLTFDLYYEFMRIHALLEEEKLDELRRALETRLPKQNYIVLRYLMLFLVTVMNNSKMNKMNSTNLAIVFGPNLIWAESAAASLSAMGPINSITKFIIENVDGIFQDHIG